MTIKVSRLRRLLMRFAATGLFVASLGTGSLALAVEGTELDAQVGLWAPFLPTSSLAGITEDGDSLGVLVGVNGHHRFEGYRTSMEADVQYGAADDTEMFAVDALLRDTWTLGFEDFSAGGGFSLMNWTQDYGPAQLQSDYIGAKLVAGWEAVFGKTPVYLDFSLGLYDLEGEATAPGISESLNQFTTTYGLDIKAETSLLGIPTRAILGMDWLSDIAKYENNAIGTGDAFILSASLEFQLY